MSHPTDDKEPIRSDSDSGAPAGSDSGADSPAAEKPETTDTGSHPSRAADATTGDPAEADATEKGAVAAGSDEAVDTPTEILERASKEPGGEPAEDDAKTEVIRSGTAAESGGSQATTPDSEQVESDRDVNAEADTESAVPVAANGAGRNEESGDGAVAGDGAEADDPAAAAGDDSPADVESAGSEASPAAAEAVRPESGGTAGQGSGQTGDDSTEDEPAEVSAESDEQDAVPEVSGPAVASTDGTENESGDTGADGRQATGDTAVEAGTADAETADTSGESDGDTTAAAADAGKTEPAEEVVTETAGSEAAGDDATAEFTVSEGESGAAVTAEKESGADSSDVAASAGIATEATTSESPGAAEAGAAETEAGADTAAGADPAAGTGAADDAAAGTGDSAADATVELEAPDAAGSEARTVVIPKPQRPEEAPTESISVRKPDPNATERIDMNQVRKAARPGPKPPGGPQSPARTDRVGSGAQGPLSKPPSTPRPQPGPKRPGPQAPSRPDQSAPQRPGGPAPQPQGAGGPQGALRPGDGPGRPQAGAQRPGSAPSPADNKATVAEQRVAQPAQFGAPGQIAQPQRVEPAPAPAGAANNRKWLIAAGAAVVLVIALIAIVAGVGSGDDSPQARIRTAIGDYTGALEGGDLAGLRDVTCGGLHDYYQGLSEEQFAGVHQQAVAEGSIPDVTSIDAVQITDRNALAQVSVQTGADPEQTTRTFDLQETDGGWKVCDPPSSTP